MRLSDFLRPEFCIMDLKAGNKEAAIKELASVLQPSGSILDKNDFIKHVLEREQLGSTGIGNRVALPHATTKSVEGMVVAFGRSVRGLDYQSLDGDSVNLFFLLGTNPQHIGIYLKFLAILAKLLNDPRFRQELMSATSADSLIEVFKKYEKG